MKTIKCRACDADIFFAPTAAGKSVPLDAKPVENGNYFLDDGGIARVIGKGQFTLVARELYLSHFATCPDAQRFRKKGA